MTSTNLRGSRSKGCNLLFRTLYIGKSNLNNTTAISSCVECRTLELDFESTESQSQIEFDDIMNEEDIQFLPVSPVYTEYSIEDRSRTESPKMLSANSATSASSQAIKRKMNLQTDDFFKEARQAVKQLTAVSKNILSISAFLNSFLIANTETLGLAS